MRLLGNILWHFPFFGFVSALLTFLIGSFFVLIVVAAPIGFGLIELSKFLLTPYSKVMINKKDLNIKTNKNWEKYELIVKIIYFPIGLILAVLTIIQVGLLFITIIGIPVALVLAKSLPTYFNPIGKKSVPRAVGYELEKQKAKEYLEKYK